MLNITKAEYHELMKHKIHRAEIAQFVWKYWIVLINKDCDFYVGVFKVFCKLRLVRFLFCTIGLLVDFI